MGKHHLDNNNKNSNNHTTSTTTTTTTTTTTRYPTYCTPLTPLLQMYIFAPMCPTFTNLYLCPNVLHFPMCPTFTNVYLFSNVPHFPNVHHFYKCIFVPECVPLLQMCIWNPLTLINPYQKYLLVRSKLHFYLKTIHLFTQMYMCFWTNFLTSHICIHIRRQ